MNKNLKDLFTYSIGYYINIFISLITIPIVTRLISPNEFGIYSLFLTTIDTISGITLLGLNQGFIRFFYSEKVENRNSLLYKCILPSTIIIVIIGIVTSRYKEEIIQYITNCLGNINFFYFIMVVLILKLLMTYSMLILRLNDNIKFFSFLNSLNKLTEIIFIFIFFYFLGNNWLVLVSANIVGIIVVVVIGVIYSYKSWSFSFRETQASLKDILRYSLPLSISMVLTWLFASADKIMLRELSTILDIGLYSGAFKLVSIVVVLQNAFTAFWTPTAYKHYENNKNDLDYFKKANDYTSLLFFSIGVFILGTRDFIFLLLGNSFSQSRFIMPMLIFIPIMYTISETTVLGIDFRKKTIYSLYISMMILLFNVFCNYFFIIKFGARGAAISSGLAYILFFFLRTYFSCRFINFNFSIKKIYTIIILMLLYSLYLTFYKNTVFSLLIMIVLELVIIKLYYSEFKMSCIFLLKEIENIFLKERGK